MFFERRNWCECEFRSGVWGKVWGTTTNVCKVVCILYTVFSHLTYEPICVSKLTIIVSDNGLSPGRRQAIIWTNAGILLIGPSGTNFNEMLIEILTFSFMKMRLKGSSAKWQPFCLGLNVLIPIHPSQRTDHVALKPAMIDGLEFWWLDMIYVNGTSVEWDVSRDSTPWRI